MSDEGTLFDWVIIRLNSNIWSILFIDFFRIGYHLKAKILEPGEKMFRGHIPVQI